MTLRERLRAMMALRPERYRTMLDDLDRRLRGTALDGVLKPGDVLPDFVLPDTDGELVFSDDLLAKGPLAVVFFRGNWCPFCRTTLEAMNATAADIAAAGGFLVAITPDTGDYARAARDDAGLHFPVLSDVDGSTGLRFGTVYRAPDALIAYWSGAGIDLAARHGDTDGFLPMPSAFVADRAGIIRFAYASGDVTDRVEPDEIVRVFRQIAAGD